MLNKPFFAIGGCWLACMLVSSTLAASDETLDQAGESVDAQRIQAELQQQIDDSDDETRAALEELRERERETRQLESQNASLTGQLAEEAERQVRLASALDTLADTRAALPDIEQNMQTQLTQWIERDLPFLKEQRLARVETLKNDEGAEPAERIEGMLDIWRTELDYGREMDTWRGRLQLDDDQQLEVDFLRIGRIGFYYLTPDGRQGGVWNAQDDEWQPLSSRQVQQVRNGLRMAEDQRAPDLLTLPLSITVSADQGE
ncbi:MULTISPECIES: DUF3450 domain-containing protein [unclassified Halomonas]|uniref:DUF3450 domain-containing protein n=1 Tax=unclassified Halomonas TaxID=2609666 RepID=UPI0006D957A1|nr:MULTISPECIES: DUF3450 domain-containing protein [unclassified Halomonas]KPQ22196.1 MAG: protein of unknown function DUF3450 [Halomonas sp. HL-93]SBR49469.1 Protein of unknown function (DUF3450) [Halomonas sp. HL-93]SNY96387.1 Protein of unknown function [Halomonas sp. hl-4]